MAVTAAPVSEDRRTRRNALPTVRPNPFARGSISNCPNSEERYTVSTFVEVSSSNNLEFSFVRVKATRR
jgi:hypothetical protein